MTPGITVERLVNHLFDAAPASAMSDELAAAVAVLACLRAADVS